VLTEADYLISNMTDLDLGDTKLNLS